VLHAPVLGPSSLAQAVTGQHQVRRAGLQAVNAYANFAGIIIVATRQLLAKLDVASYYLTYVPTAWGSSKFWYCSHAAPSHLELGRWDFIIGTLAVDLAAVCTALFIQSTYYPSSGCSIALTNAAC
jgi:hypothetical protein